MTAAEDATRALTMIQSHTVECSRRYEESSRALDRLHGRIDALNRMAAGVLCSMVTLCVGELLRILLKI